MKDIKTAIFDLDGTLIDSVEPYLQMVIEVFQEVGFSAPNREKIMEIVGQAKRIFHELIPEDVKERDGLINHCRKIAYDKWLNTFSLQIDVINGGIETLERVKEKGITIGIATSATNETLEVFRRSRLDALAQVVITREEVPRMKPAPDSILECLRRLSSNPEESVYIGDAPIDIMAGKAAGTFTVGVLTGLGTEGMLQKEGADRIIKDITYLLEFL